MKFLLFEVSDLYKSTISHCMEYNHHVWGGAASCYLDMLDKLQKQECMTVSPSVAPSLEPLVLLKNYSQTKSFL